MKYPRSWRSYLHYAVGLVILLFALGKYQHGNTETPTYKVLSDFSKGNLSITVTYDGPALETKPIKVTKDAKICGETVTNESILIDSDNCIKIAIVYLNDVMEGKEF